MSSFYLATMLLAGTHEILGVENSHWFRYFEAFYYSSCDFSVTSSEFRVDNCLDWPNYVIFKLSEIFYGEQNKRTLPKVYDIFGSEVPNKNITLFICSKVYIYRQFYLIMFIFIKTDSQTYFIDLIIIP